MSGMDQQSRNFKKSLLDSKNVMALNWGELVDYRNAYGKWQSAKIEHIDKVEQGRVWVVKRFFLRFNDLNGSLCGHWVRVEDIDNRFARFESLSLSDKCDNPFSVGDHVDIILPYLDSQIWSLGEIIEIEGLQVKVRYATEDKNVSAYTHWYHCHGGEMAELGTHRKSDQPGKSPRRIGQKVIVQDLEGGWYRATIVATKGNYVKVSYDRWDGYGEWIHLKKDRDRIKARKSQRPPKDSSNPKPEHEAKLESKEAVHAVTDLTNSDKLFDNSYTPHFENIAISNSKDIVMVDPDYVVYFSQITSEFSRLKLDKSFISEEGEQCNKWLHPVVIEKWIYVLRRNRNVIFRICMNTGLVLPFVDFSTVASEGECEPQLISKNRGLYLFTSQLFKIELSANLAEVPLRDCLNASTRISLCNDGSRYIVSSTNPVVLTYFDSNGRKVWSLSSDNDWRITHATGIVTCPQTNCAFFSNRSLSEIYMFSPGEPLVTKMNTEVNGIFSSTKLAICGPFLYVACKGAKLLRIDIAAELNLPSVSSVRRRSLSHPDAKDVVTFDIEGEIIYLQKYVLTQKSGYFRRKFSADWRNYRSGKKLKVPDTKYETFCSVAIFLKSEELETSPSRCVNVLELAERFEIPELKDACEDFLIKRLKKDQLAYLRRVAVRSGASNLLQRCNELMSGEEHHL